MLDSKSNHEFISKILQNNFKKTLKVNFTDDLIKSHSSKNIVLQDNYLKTETHGFTALRPS